VDLSVLSADNETENSNINNRGFSSVKDDLVYVKKSKIHGMGLFAKKDIAKGQSLGKVQGMRTSRDGPHVLWMEDHKYGFKVRCILKYINHSSEPNACYYDDLTVVALRDIKMDEEITHYYGDEWEE